MAHPTSKSPKPTAVTIREPRTPTEVERLAFVLERARRDEISLLNTARREGYDEGYALGYARSFAKALAKELQLPADHPDVQRKLAKHMIQHGTFTEQQIAANVTLTPDDFQALRAHIRTAPLNRGAPPTEEGREEGRVERFEEGTKITQRNMAKRLIATGLLSDQQIAASTELSVDEVAALHTRNDH